MITGLDCFANSPRQRYRKCSENSMENMHTDARMSRVNLKSSSVSTFFPSSTLRTCKTPFVKFIATISPVSNYQLCILKFTRRQGGQSDMV